MCKASLNVTIQVPTFGVLLDLLSWHDACEPFNPVANKTVEAAVAWAIPKQDVRCTDFGSGRLTIKPFPSPSRFAGDAAAMGRHVQELEDHLHQRDGHIRELEDTIVALEDRHRVEIAEIKSIMVANR